MRERIPRLCHEIPRSVTHLFAGFCRETRETDSIAGAPRADLLVSPRNFCLAGKMGLAISFDGQSVAGGAGEHRLPHPR